MNENPSPRAHARFLATLTQDRSLHWRLVYGPTDPDLARAWCSPHDAVRAVPVDPSQFPGSHEVMREALLGSLPAGDDARMNEDLAALAEIVGSRQDGAEPPPTITLTPLWTGDSVRQWRVLASIGRREEEVAWSARGPTMPRAVSSLRNFVEGPVLDVLADLDLRRRDAVAVENALIVGLTHLEKVLGGSETPAARGVLHRLTTRPVRMAMIFNGVSLPIEPFFERLRESFERSVANAAEDELRSGPLARVIEALRDVETAVKTGTLNAVRKVFPDPEE